MSTQQFTQLGEIVTWKSPTSVSFAVLRNSLQQSGLDPEMARELLPRYAFSRAAKDLDEQRVIKKVNEDKSHLWFQFTREYFDKQRTAYDYRFEAILKLNKTTGSVECADQQLAAQAHALVMEQMDKRSSGDITRIVQKLFDRETKYGDLFPIREQGGAYFVPAHYQYLVDKVETMMGMMGGRVLRYEITASDRNKLSMAETVSHSVDTVIGQCDAAIEAFDPKEATSTEQNNLLRKIVETRGMITAYKDVLSHEVFRLENKLAESLERFNDKLDGKDEPAPPPPQPASPAVDIEQIRRLNKLLGKK